MERVAKLGDVDVAPLKLTFFPGLCESFYRSMKVINAGVCVCVKIDTTFAICLAYFPAIFGFGCGRKGDGKVCFDGC